MGLQSVELLLAIEDEFEIVIPESEASGLQVVGNLCDCIGRMLRERGETVDEEAVWNRLRDLIVKHLGVRPEEVTRSADIVADLGAD